MDPRLLEYYNRELQFMRETGAEFAREYPRVKAILQPQLVFHPDASRESDELGAARQKDVLPGVDFDAVDLE